MCNVASLIDELRTDHRNMVLLLDLVEAETGRVAAGSEPDYELLENIMTYVADYPDAVHHPREDRLYRHLKSRHPDIDQTLQRVESDHEKLEAAGARLREKIKTLAAGFAQPPDRDAVMRNLQTYATNLRRHMYWEEQELFMLADQIGHERVAKDITSTEGDDPMFGRKVEKRFRRLLNRIQRRMVWDIQHYLG